jgi:hypothetical protein
MPPDQEEALPVGSVPDRPGVTLVTPENFDAYVDEKLGVKPAETVNEDPEAVAAAEAAEIAAKQAEADAKAAEPKEGDVDGSKVFFKGKWTPKHDFSYRLHLKTEETKAEAKAEIDKAAAEAKSAREEADKAAKEAAALRAKYEPPKSTELGPKPTPDKYQSVDAYSDALIEWAEDKARIEDAAKQAEAKQVTEREAVVKAWNERQEAIKTEVPDYAEKIANSGVKVSDQMRDAIVESDNGPRILYHLAENPELADALGKMTVGKMLREIGKLDGTFGGTVKPDPKSEKKTPIAEISKAPAPITPLRGGNAGSGNKMDSNGNFTGTFEEYKALRNAGKIQ